MKKYSIEEAVAIATQELTKEFENELPNKENIADKNVKTVQKDNSVIVTLIYKVTEEIGEEIKQY